MSKKVPLHTAAEAGDLVLQNTGLVTFAIKKFGARFPGSYEDKFQSALVAMLRCTKTFNPEIAAFSTYAIRAIFREWQRWQMGHSVIEVATSQIRPLAKYRSLLHQDAMDGVQHNERYYQAKLGLSKSSWFMLRKAYVATTPQIPLEPEDTATADPLETWVNNDELAYGLSFLGERAKDIIVKRFGLADGQELTLEEVGKHYGMTRERVRQIEAAALAHMRHVLEGGTKFTLKTKNRKAKSLKKRYRVNDAAENLKQDIKAISKIAKKQKRKIKVEA